MLRVLVDGPGPVADALAGHGHEPVVDGSAPVALTVSGTGSGDADVVLDVRGRDAVAAVAAVERLHVERLGPWSAALASGRPDVTAAPHLLDHDPDWAVVAARRSVALHRAITALGPGLRRIDHIGSTAVPGLAAKPYLDLQVTLDELPDADVLAAALRPLGWAPAVGARPDSPGVHRDLPHPDDRAPQTVYAKRLLVAPDPARPAILHVRLTGSPFARRAVRFRDLLRADVDHRLGYERTKAAAAQAHAGDEDYDDYTRDKGAWLVGAYREVDRRTADVPWPGG